MVAESVNNSDKFTFAHQNYNLRTKFCLKGSNSFDLKNHHDKFDLHSAPLDTLSRFT